MQFLLVTITIRELSNRIRELCNCILTSNNLIRELYNSILTSNNAN